MNEFEFLKAKSRRLDKIVPLINPPGIKILVIPKGMELSEQSP